MTPFEMVSNNNTAVPNNNNINHNNNIPNFPKFTKFPTFQMGDFVRVPDKRNLYSKGYTTNWNRELFKIQKFN